METIIKASILILVWLIIIKLLLDLLDYTRQKRESKKLAQHFINQLENEFKNNDNNKKE